jgi:ubiquinone/menaquinone biosynthesis C-methylase UbiE
MDVAKLLKAKSGIRLDIGGGNNPNPGFVNIDILPLPKVDIVWDLEEFPWPLPDECVTVATASHVLEHINPHKGVFIRFMDEVWRVLKPGAQFAFVSPHASSHGFQQDPTHCNMINETTLHYFDPDPEHKNIGESLYQFYRPKPWKIIRQYFNPNANLEVLLEKRLDDKSFHEDQTILKDITKEDVRHEVAPWEQR